MNGMNRSLIQTVALAAIALLAAPAPAAETPTLDEIRAKTAERLAALQGKEIKIEWTSERDVPAGSVSATAPIGLISPKERAKMKIETVPAEPTTLPSHGTLLIRGESARSESVAGVLFATENRPPTEHRSIIVLHDKVCTTLDPDSKSASISSQDRLFDQPKNRILGWFATDHHLDKPFPSKTDWSVESREEGGKRLVVLHRSPAEAHGLIEELWLDPARGYLPFKQTLAGQKPNGQTRLEYAAEYAQRPDGVWAPTGGTFNVTRGGTDQGATTVRVASISIEPASSDDSSFKIELSEGVHLVKEDEKGFYIVGKNGALEPDPRARTFKDNSPDALKRK